MLRATAVTAKRAAISSARPVTSAVRLVESTVNDVLGLAASVKVHERSGAVEFRLPGGLSATNESTCQALLTGLMLLFSELHSEYPDNIEVMEA